MNVIGTRTLLIKEVRRFMRAPWQMLLTPLVSTSLYFIVFGYTLGSGRGAIEGVPYETFIVPGLVFMSITNNAFVNSSSSFFLTRIQGTIVDLVVAPMGPTEIILGFVGGAMVRGILVGALTWGVAALFTSPGVASPSLCVALAVLSAYVFGVLGLLAGLWSERSEQISLFPTFLMPLMFLGGIFYPVRGLAEPLRTISLLNPVVHMVQALRGALLGTDEGSLVGLSLLCLFAGTVTTVTWRLLRAGYKLRA